MFSTMEEFTRTLAILRKKRNRHQVPSTDLGISGAESDEDAGCTLTLLHFGELRNIMRKRVHSAWSLAPVEVFVRCMIAMFGQTQAEKENRHLPGLLHRDDRTDRSPFTNKSRFFAESRLCRSFHTFDIRSIETAFEWRLHRFRLHFDVRIQLGHIALQQVEDFLWCLVRNEPHADLQFAATRHHSLDAGPMVPAGQAMNLESRSCPNPARHFSRIIRSKRVESMGLFEALDLKT